MSLFYIGGFPPPYGGVTTKNDNLFIALREQIDIERIDFNEIKRKNLKQAFNLIDALLNRQNRFVVGVAGKKTRKNLCKLMYFVNRKAMEKSIIFLMGGTAANDIASDKEYQKYISRFKRVYAETHGMVSTLRNAGLNNAEYYPNCRFKPGKNFSIMGETSQGLKCVFFSLIRKEKGADLVLDVAAQMAGISFTFYGPIEEDYKTEFLEGIKNLPNTSYYGVFSGNADEVYQELGKYDVLLFPTKYDIEGVPGILVESKIAGITCVVSDKSYNAEIVKDGIEGIVLKNNTSEELKRSLEKLESNREKLSELKESNRHSANHYFIESYIDRIIECVGGVIHKKRYDFRTVFLSRVCQDKGIDVVLKAAQLIPNAAFHIYGPIAEDSFEILYDAVCKNDNVFYHGIFDGKDDLLYHELSKYDVVLLPTRWASEGVPGILVEAKIAGIPAIVSDICYNAEIVHNEVDGIVLKDNNERSLSDAIRKLAENKQFYNAVRVGAKNDSDAYYVESYIDSLVKQIKG